MAQGTQITIPALGRHALLGFLYDERSDQIISKNVFKGPVTGNAIESTENSKTSLKMSLTETNRDKFRLYDIKASIQANLLSGMLQVKGSAGYLQEEKHSAREVKGIMLYECTTTVENLQIYFDELVDQYNTEVVNQPGATHIVTQIKWGGSVAIEFSKKIDEDQDEKNIKGSLEIEFEKAKGLLSIKASASVDIGLRDKESSSEFSMNVKGDIILPQQIPTTAEQVQELIQQVPDLIKKVNEGKGVPLEFTLTPLGELRNHLKQTSNENEFAKQLDEAILNDFINIFETISEIGQELNDYVTDFRGYSICVPQKARNDIINLEGKFKTMKLKFVGKMKETIVSVRSGTMDQDELSKICEEYEANEYSPANVQNKLQEFHPTIRKIELYKTICKSFPNVQYFGYRSNLDAALLGNIKNVIYALFLFPKSPENNAELHQENEHLFFNKLNHPFNKLFVIDCEFEFSQSPKVKRTVIQQIVNGKVNIEDVNEVVKRQKITEPLEIKALGRFNKMGQLYDAKTDTFLKDNFLSPEIPQSLIQVLKKSGQPEVFDVSSERMSDKFKALKVGPELQYSLLAGMVNLSRSGQYLTLASSDDNLKLAAKVNQLPIHSFVHLRRLTKESVSVSDPDLFKYIVANALSKGATHFVTQIEYGFSTVFSAQKQFLNVEEENTRNDSDLKCFTENLKGIVKRMQISEKDNNELSEADLETLSEEFIVKVYSDIQGEECEPEVLQGNADMLFFFNEVFVPKQLSKNNGKGMPLAYLLYPLANLGTEVGILSPYINYGRISEHFPNPKVFISIIDDASTVKNQIEEMAKHMQENDDCVTDEDFALLESIRQEFDSTIGKLLQNCKDVIINFKKGETNADEFKKLLVEYKNLRVFDTQNRYVKLESIDFVNEKIQLWKQFRNNEGIVCIGRPNPTNSITEIFADGYSVTCQMKFLFYHSSWAKSNNDLWQQTSAAFLNLIREENTKMFVVNCEFKHEICKNVENPKIHEYTNGILTSEYFLARHDEVDNPALIRHDPAEGVREKSEEIARQNRTAEFQKAEERLTDRYVVYLESGMNGLVNLPLKGTCFLKYKANGQNDDELRCLWTLICKHDNKYYATKLKISLLGDNLNGGPTPDILVSYKWNQYQDESLSFSDLRNNTEELFSSPDSEPNYRRFIYLHSKRPTLEAAFIIQVDVLESIDYIYVSMLNWWFNDKDIPGEVDYDQYKQYRSISIAVVPPKPCSLEFTMNHLHSNHDGDLFDILDVYALGQGGIPQSLGRFQGEITEPVSYSTEFPILALFSCESPYAGTFKVSWK